MSLSLRITLFGLLLGLVTAPVSAQGGGSPLIRFNYQPTNLAQVAIWIETASGEYMQTVALTEATALRGIGNRPGALQMNSAFRWPFGRRESVLPIWAHRRAAAPGAQQFKRVIFQQRVEGFASRQIADSTRDDYFCLSFDSAWQASNDPRDTLDAITCPSVFSSDKGRFITQGDVDSGYSEGWENLDASDVSRSLGLDSLYPPRRDVVSASAVDSDDVDLFAQHAASVMPEIDAVTMATPVGDTHQVVQFSVPPAWPSGDYVAWIEVNVEGDYNADFNATIYPTPLDPTRALWDVWAMGYGYPYRGQPSVVFSVPFTIGSAIEDAWTGDPVGYGSVHGDVETMVPMDGKLTNDPIGAPGSGVDRLATIAPETRFSLRVIPTNICGVPSPPSACEIDCASASVCPLDFICGSDGFCEGICDDDRALPGMIEEFEITNHEDEKEAHHFATMSFIIPASYRDLEKYDVRVSREPILSEADFVAAEQAKRATLAAEALDIPTDGTPRTRLEVDFGGLTHQTHYFVAIRAIDICNLQSSFVTAEIETTEIHFTTVSPCFVATAAYGTPMATEIGSLRRFRDRHLMTNALGRLFVDAYYTVGPHAAEWIAEDESARSITRELLAPLVDIVQALE